jgi:hypothetical protein
MKFIEEIMGKLSVIQMKKKTFINSAKDPWKNDELGFIKNIKLLLLEKYCKENEDKTENIHNTYSTQKICIQIIYRTLTIL